VKALNWPCVRQYFGKMRTPSCYRDFLKLPFYTSFQRVILKKIIFTTSFSVLTKRLSLILLSHQFNNTKTNAPSKVTLKITGTASALVVGINKIEFFLSKHHKILSTLRERYVHPKEEMR
jgi:hypothetical protein